MADMFTELDRARRRPAPAFSPVVDMLSKRVLVREVTHHGSFYNVRVVALAELTPATVAGMLREAPYVVSHGPAIKSIHDQLAAVGRASHGWTDWEVVR